MGVKKKKEKEKKKKAQKREFIGLSTWARL